MSRPTAMSHRPQPEIVASPIARSIPQIDKDINDLRRKHRNDPDFRARETALFRERGFAQLERDKRKYERAVAVARSAALPRRNKCHHCGGSGYARAAQ